MGTRSTATATGDLTSLLHAWTAGESEALDQLIPLVLDELRSLARSHLRHVSPTNTLQPTAIVHEAYLRLAGREGLSFASRSHFFAFASKLMRDLLVDHLRKRRASRRGGDLERVPFEEALEHPGGPSSRDTILAVHELLSTLERRDPRRGRVVELRYFGGLTMPEIAEVTGRSLATVERDWQFARRWLVKELHYLRR